MRNIILLALLVILIFAGCVTGYEEETEIQPKLLILWSWVQTKNQLENQLRIEFVAENKSETDVENARLTWLYELENYDYYLTSVWISLKEGQSLHFDFYVDVGKKEVVSVKYDHTIFEE